MDRMICDDFRHNVNSQLEKLGWTRADLAERMHVTPGYITQLLNGHHEPGLRVVERVATALGVPADRLIKKIVVRG